MMYLSIITGSKCAEGQFRCSSWFKGLVNVCVDKQYVCNSFVDCQDYSDEDDEMCTGITFLYYAIY
jgi:hypothetical protein